MGRNQRDEGETELSVGILSSISGGAGTITIRDGVNFFLNESTGTEFGTAATNKLGFWGQTPVIQASSAVTVSGAFTENAGDTAVNKNSTFNEYTIGQMSKALIDAGILSG